MLNPRKQAFTLVEVMLAILIMAIAGTIILTSATMIRSQAQKTVVREHTRKIQEAYDQWLGNQQSIEYARSIFNPAAYIADGASSVNASYPADAAAVGHLTPYLNSEFISSLQKKGSDPGVFETGSMAEIGAHITIFWDTNYRESNINVILFLP